MSTSHTTRKRSTFSSHLLTVAMVPEYCSSLYHGSNAHALTRFQTPFSGRVNLLLGESRLGFSSSFESHFHIGFRLGFSLSFKSRFLYFSFRSGFSLCIESRFLFSFRFRLSFIFRCVFDSSFSIFSSFHLFFPFSFDLSFYSSYRLCVSLHLDSRVFFSVRPSLSFCT